MQQVETELEPLTNLLTRIGLAEVEDLLERLIQRRHLGRLFLLKNRSKVYQVKFGNIDGAICFFNPKKMEITNRERNVLISSGQFEIIRANLEALLEYSPST